MGTYNICFYGEISNIIPESSSNTHVMLSVPLCLKCRLVQDQLHNTGSEKLTRSRWVFSGN